ncbi:MAG: PPA1309 family protein [Marmoricola sp.]
MLSAKALAAVVREIEAHAAESGWDQPARLFALVPTAELARAEPELAGVLGLDVEAEGLTPIDQELPADVDLEGSLASMMWPEEVTGCAAVVERIVLPPSADGAVPDDRARAASYAAEHPERQELRMVAAATRDGATQCALRFRSHDEPASVVVGTNLVPALLELLQASLVDDGLDHTPTEEIT